MNIFITELSKYLIAILIVLYTLESFFALRYRSETRREGVCFRQTVFILIIQFLFFVQILTRTGDFKYLFYYAAQLAILFGLLLSFRMLVPNSSRFILNQMGLLLMTGMTILLRIDAYKAAKQYFVILLSLVAGILVATAVYYYDVLERIYWYYALIGILALGMVFLFGRTTYGSKLSVSIAGLSFQSSEFVKILFVFFLAGAFAKASDFRQVAITGFVAAIHVLILVLSRDLGSALIFAVVYTFMVFVATGRYLYLCSFAVLGILASAVAYRLFSHVRIRFEVWNNPWVRIDSSGYQITQSLFGMSAGGWFGLGLFGGMPKSIPFVEDDFIFSAIGEELGLIYAICLLFICLSVLFMFLWEAVRLRNLYFKLATVGMGVTFLFQVFLTVGGGSQFIPLTGVTLPLVSYGGSSILASMLTFSIFEAICRIRADEHLDAIERMKGRVKEDREDDEE